MKNSKQFLSLTDLFTQMELTPQWYFKYQNPNSSRFGLNTFCYYSANLWNKFYHAFLYKQLNLTKAKLKILLEMHFLDTSA